MDKKTKILVGIIVLFFVISLGAKHHKFSTEQDFYISSELSCDVETESCFVWDCDPKDEECDQTPYKYIWKHASFVPTCSPEDEECAELSCSETEDDCEIIECSDETLGEEEFCYEHDTE